MDIEELLNDVKYTSSRNRLHILNSLIQVYKAAYAAENFSSALRAIELLAKELGFLTARTGRFENVTIDELRFEELKSLFGLNVVTDKASAASDQ